MPPFWWKLLKIMLLLFALFTTIVCINSEMSKMRREAEAEAEAAAVATNSSINLTPFLSDNLLSIMRNMTLRQTRDEAETPTQRETQQQQQHQAGEVELPAEDIDERVRSIFKISDGEGVMLFNSTTQQQSQGQSSPQMPKPTPRRPISDNKYRTRQPTPPTSPSTIDTGDHQCVDGFNQSRSFCTKVNNYPDLSGLKGILSRRFANFFSDEPQPTDVGLRINDDEQYLCNSHVRYLYPKLGQRLDHSWQYIVNTDDFKQGILIEECDDEGEKCQFLDGLPNNYVSICKQHYVIRHLATVNNVSTGQPEVANEPFKIPSCCKCVIKSKFSVDSSP